MEIKNADWYDLLQDTNWTPTYVTEEELFPPQLSDPYKIPVSEWERFDEPFKVTYREYVKTQREKEVGAYSVKAALSRVDFYKKADPGWKALLQLHFGAIPFVEYGSVSAFARVTRFGRGPGMRNMACFGSLDEIRHTQIQMLFGYEFLSVDRAFDWAHKAPATDNWIVMSERHCFDDIEHTRDAVTAAVMLNFAFEQGFTNLQFVALSADARRYGDFSFATMLQTVQSDEARHSQIGEPLIGILVRNGKKEEAQKMVDISFWRVWKQFSALSGIAFDYYTPLENRELSLKEFVHEFVTTQFLRNLNALGLEKPWYWDDHFLPDVETYHHAQQIGIYMYRDTGWWDPIAGVTPAERDWLEEKYPGWNDTFGRTWDVITKNLKEGRMDRLTPTIAPVMCNMVGLELSGVPGTKWDVRDHTLDFNGRRYHFGSPVDKWIFEQDPARYQNYYGLSDRMVNGTIPATPEGLYEYMDMKPEERGTCGMGFKWIDSAKRVA